MHKIIVTLSYKINTYHRYNRVKSFVRSILTDNKFRYKRYFDIFMIFLILSSTSILVTNEISGTPLWLTSFDLYVISSIFALEYLLRLWISQDLHNDIISAQRRNRLNTFRDYFDVIILPRLQYIVSFPALLDLIAIFPKFRVLRLFKLYHYIPGISSLFSALSKRKFEFTFLGYMLIFVPFVVGSLFYLTENETNKAIGSYLDAVYWAMVTVSTVGYGDITPVTDIGKIISMFSIVFGVALISFTTSIMVSAFSERFDEMRNIGSINQVQRVKNVILINGYDHLGKTIAKELQKSQEYEPAIIEDDEVKAAMAQSDGFYAINADGSSASLIEELTKEENILSMLTLKSDDIDNIYFILNVKSVHQEPIRSCKIFTIMNQPYLLPQYIHSRVDGVVEPYEQVNRRALRHILAKRVDIDQKAMLFGYTHKSRELCKMLKKRGISMAIYDNIEANQQQALEDGFEEVFYIDFKLAMYLDDIPFASYMMIICAMNDDALNVYHALSLKSYKYRGEIVALSDSKEDNRKLKLAGVDKIFDMYEESAMRFIEMIKDIRS
ncbi:MAG: NAD-binding protein [Campylobacterota bacterium]|nr:NAD-binding protein [Campylobacterota bacterium]